MTQRQDTKAKQDNEPLRFPAPGKLNHFWEYFEPPFKIEKLTDVFEFLDVVLTKCAQSRTPDAHSETDDGSFLFLWRGQWDSNWGLFTTLYRNYVMPYAYTTRHIEETLTAATRRQLATSHTSPAERLVAGLMKRLLNNSADTLKKNRKNRKAADNNSLKHGELLDTLARVLPQVLKSVSQDDTHSRESRVKLFEKAAKEPNQTILAVIEKLLHKGHGPKLAEALFDQFDLVEQLKQHENDLLADLAKAGLAAPGGIFLPRLSQLAMLRHYGGPARLLDVTQNPFVALFFACNEMLSAKDASQHGCRHDSEHDVPDGRLFLIAIPRSNVIASVPDDVEQYLDRLQEEKEEAPALTQVDPTAQLLNKLRSFKKQVPSNKYVGFWAPALSMDARINAQQAGFVFAPVAWGVTFGQSGAFDIRTHQIFTDLAVKPHQLKGKRGQRVTEAGLFTCRVNRNCKNELLKALRTQLNIDFNRLFPDFAGFSQGKEGLL